MKNLSSVSANKDIATKEYVDAKVLQFTVTLASASWSSNTQTVSNANFVTSGYTYFVNPDAADYLDYCDAGIYADDVSVSGQMTFHCQVAPSSNISVVVTRFKI